MKTLITTALIALTITFTAAAQESSCPDGLTFEGRCNGNRVEWCEYGEGYYIDCGEQGLTCAKADGYYDCVQSQSNGNNTPGTASSLTDPNQPQGPDQANNGSTDQGGGLKGGSKGGDGGCTATSRAATGSGPLALFIIMIAILLAPRRRPR